MTIMNQGEYEAQWAVGSGISAKIRVLNIIEDNIFNLPRGQKRE